MHKTNDIFTYLKWRGDLSFKQAPFNEIDNLILSNLSYIHFTDIVSSKEKYRPILLKEAVDDFFKLNRTNDYYRDELDIPFIKELRNSNRFAELKLYFLKEVYISKYETQFGAMCIDLGNKITYISFRGTDEKLYGWKEDFNLSFEVVPAQKFALEYLERAALIKHNKLYVGGHSKGGNLAMYASAFASKRVQNKILKIYNNDGPGFDFSFVNKAKLELIKDRLVSFTPETSIIGAIMNQIKEFKIIKSNDTLLMQHSPYGWLVNVDKFVYCDDVDNLSKIYHETITHWLNSMPLDKRELFINSIYELLMTLKTDSINELLPSTLSNIKHLTQGFKELDETQTKVISESFNKLYSSFKSTILTKYKKEE